MYWLAVCVSWCNILSVPLSERLAGELMVASVDSTRLVTIHLIQLLMTSSFCCEWSGLVWSDTLTVADWLAVNSVADVPVKVPKTLFLDGVCLSEAGLNQIRTLSLKFAEKKQRPRWRRNPSASTHPALLMMMAEKSEDDQENGDSKAATIGVYSGQSKGERGGTAFPYLLFLVYTVPPP